MNGSTLEKRIVEHCSPTLARLKCGSILKIGDIVPSEIEIVNELLRTKGVELTVLRSTGCRLAYVFRRDMLETVIKNEDTRSFLIENDYNCASIDDLIRSLKEKMSVQKCIPHEIGVFLGYPLEDVKGFIDNRGTNFKCMGCWKVYGDEDRANATFAKYRKCKSKYTEKYAMGTPIIKLTVS